MCVCCVFLRHCSTLLMIATRSSSPCVHTSRDTQFLTFLTLFFLLFSILLVFYGCKIDFLWIWTMSCVYVLCMFVRQEEWPQNSWLLVQVVREGTSFGRSWHMNRKVSLNINYGWNTEILNRFLSWLDIFKLYSALISNLVLIHTKKTSILLDLLNRSPLFRTKYSQKTINHSFLFNIHSFVFIHQHQLSL